LQGIFQLSETKCYAKGTKIILDCFSLLSALSCVKTLILSLKGLEVVYFMMELYSYVQYSFLCSS